MTTMFALPAAHDLQPPTTYRPDYWAAEVVSHERRGSLQAVFRVRPATPVRHEAGQYVHLECGYSPYEWRPYSVANAPRPDLTMDFHVSAGAGPVGAALVHRLRVGDVVRVGPARGAMTLDRTSTRDIVCVAEGTGLAAVKALVDELSRGRHHRWTHLFVGARTRSELYDLAALRELAAGTSWLTVVPVCSDDPDFPGEVGPVSAVVERFAPWPDHEFYVSGPGSMVRATLRALAALGVPAEHVRYEALLNGEV